MVFLNYFLPVINIDLCIQFCIHHALTHSLVIRSQLKRFRENNKSRTMFYFFSAQLRTDFVQACVIWGEQYYGLYQFYLLLMYTQLTTVPAYVRTCRQTHMAVHAKHIVLYWSLQLVVAHCPSYVTYIRVHQVSIICHRSCICILNIHASGHHTHQHVDTSAALHMPTHIIVTC